ncbi:MAG: CYTH domain-containing protein [Nanoarchaeota archaeon]
MQNIEVEVRSFISKEQYEKLLEFFNAEAELLKEDYQETFYFNCEQDLRIQRNNFFSKIWMKKGNIHDAHREEIEIKFDRADFDKLERLFISIGFDIEIKWFRKRFEFKWKGIIICLDYTKGYGYIIELEKMSSDENKESEYLNLKEKITSLGIEITPKEEFDAKFWYYKKNWKTLIGE